MEVHIHDLTVTEFTHPQADVFVKSAPELVARHFHVVQLADGEAGLVYKDGVLVDVLAPGARRLYWKEPVDVRVEILDVATELEVPEKVRKLLARPREDLALTKARNRHVYVAEVADKHVGLLIVDGQLGAHARTGAVRLLDLQPYGEGGAGGPAPAGDGRSRARRS